MEWNRSRATAGCLIVAALLMGLRAPAEQAFTIVHKTGPKDQFELEDVDFR